MTLQTDLSALPMGAQKMIALIGLPLTLRLVDAHGGCTINLYNSEASMDKMADVVGREAAAKLLKFYGNVPFTVPLCHQALKVVRNREVLATFDRLTMQENHSARAAVTAITRQFTPYIHERTIWRILKTTGEVKKPDPRQLSLL